MIQYYSMATKPTVSEISFPSVAFESAGLATNSSYSCGARVHRVI